MNSLHSMPEDQANVDFADWRRAHVQGMLDDMQAPVHRFRGGKAFSGFDEGEQAMVFDGCGAERHARRIEAKDQRRLEDKPLQRLGQRPIVRKCGQ